MKPNSTEIIFVVDRSGSMESIANDMKGGFDSFIREQKKLPGECQVTLARFDNEYELVFERKDLTDVPPLELIPRGGTALNDAVGRTINAVGERLAKTPEDQRPSKILFVIITDGEENASQEFKDTRKVLELITHQREKYSWEFIFLGASLNATQVAQNMGIPKARAVMYAASAGPAAAGVMRSVNLAASRYRGAGGQSIGDMHENYTASVAELEKEEESSQQTSE